MAIENMQGRRVLIQCSNFFYEGVVEKVDASSVTLTSSPRIVYETGKSSDTKWLNAQPCPADPWEISRDSIESYGVVPLK